MPCYRISALALFISATAGCLTRQADSIEQAPARRTVQKTTTSSPDAAAVAEPELPDAELPLDAEGDREADGGDAEAQEPVGEPDPNIFTLTIERDFDHKSFKLQPLNIDGEFNEEHLDKAREAFSHRDGKRTHPVHPRLLSVIYRAARYFDADHVTVTSGYRPGRASSLHAWGRAADIRLDGVPQQELAEHLRTYGFVGVGIYPRTGGLHIDVRDQSYFWISYAPRGKRWREQPILQKLAKAMDDAARERGVEPTDPLPQKALRARATVSRRRRAAKRRPVKRRPVKRRSAKRRPVKGQKAKRGTKRPLKRAGERPAKARSKAAKGRAR